MPYLFRKKLPFLNRHGNENSHSRSSMRESVVSYPGQLGQMDMWGPYPSGRSGHTQLFTLIDAFSQFAVSLPCSNKSGDIPKLVKQVLGFFPILWS